MAKLLAFENDQQCSFVNHCGPYLLAGLWYIIGAGLFSALVPCVLPISPCLAYIPCCALNGIQRHNLRYKAKIGRDQDWFGDILIGNIPCTAPCGMCQALRTVPVESWDWLGACQKGEVSCMGDEFKYIATNSEPYVPGQTVTWESQPIPPLLPCMKGEEGSDETSADKPKKKKVTSV